MISMKEWSEIEIIILIVLGVIFISLHLIFKINPFFIPPFFPTQKKDEKKWFILTFIELLSLILFLVIGTIIPVKKYIDNNITKLCTLEEYKLVQTDEKYVANYKIGTNDTTMKVTYKTDDGYKTVSSNDLFVHYHEVQSEDEMRFEKCIYKINDYSIFGKNLTTVGYEIYLTESVLKELGQEDYLSIEK